MPMERIGEGDAVELNGAKGEGRRDMPITLTAIESFPVYAVVDGEVTSTDHDFGTLVFTDDAGRILGQCRVLISDVDLGEATTEEMQSSIEDDGPKTVTMTLS